jgi:hypothetical protein
MTLETVYPKIPGLWWGWHDDDDNVEKEFGSSYISNKTLIALHILQFKLFTVCNEVSDIITLYQ